MITAIVWIVMLMIQVILMNRNSSAWVDDASTTPGGLPGPGAPPGGKGGDTEIVPPPPAGVPNPAGPPTRPSPATSRP